MLTDVTPGAAVRRGRTRPTQRAEDPGEEDPDAVANQRNDDRYDRSTAENPESFVHNGTREMVACR